MKVDLLCPLTHRPHPQNPKVNSSDCKTCVKSWNLNGWSSIKYIHFLLWKNSFLLQRTWLWNGMILSCHCTRASEDAGVYKKQIRRALKGTTRKVRQVTPSCLLWNKISRAKNLEQHSPPLTYIHRTPITWQLRSGAADCQNGDLCLKHEINARNMQTDTACGFVSFIRLILNSTSVCMQKKRTYSVLSVETPTRSLNLYSMCTRRLTSIVPRSIHMGAWVTFCREHMQLMKKLIWWRAQMTTKQMD